MRRPLLRAAIAAVLAVCNALPASAHGGGEPLIHVPLDHVQPGSTFPLIGADLGAGTSITFEISVDDLVVVLGSTRTGADGHFETTLALPDTFPAGYARLRAAGADGSAAEMWVRVDPAPAGVGTRDSGDGVDLVPFVTAGMALLALAIVLVRSRGARPATNARR